MDLVAIRIMCTIELKIREMRFALYLFNYYIKSDFMFCDLYIELEI